MPDTTPAMKQEKFSNNMKKLLPIYFIVDVSGSMQGKSIESVKNALADIKRVFIKQNAEELINTEIRVSVMVFDYEAKWIQEMIYPDQLDPDLINARNFCTDMGTAFSLLETSLHDAYMRNHVKDTAGYNYPVILFLTDGMPTDHDADNDQFTIQLNRLKSNHWFATAYKHVFCCFDEEHMDEIKDLMVEFTGTPKSVYTVKDTETLMAVLPHVAEKTSGTASRLQSEDEKLSKWQEGVKKINELVDNIVATIDFGDGDMTDVFSGGDEPDFSDFADDMFGGLGPMDPDDLD